MRTERKLYISFHIFFALLLWVPIYYEFQKIMGLTDQEIFNIQAYYYIAFCFLEIPTGGLSDRFGHKLALSLGAFILLLSNIIPIFTPYHSYRWESFALHFFLIAGARSLISGAASAYLYDTLLSKNRIDQYKEIEGSARSYALMAKIIGWSAVGPLMKISVTLPYSLTALFSLVSFILAMRLPQLPVFKKDKDSIGFIEGLKILKNSPRLIHAILLGVAMFLMIRMCQVNLFQPLLKAKHFDLKWFGILMAIMTIFESIGAKFAYRLEKIKDHSLVFLATSVISLSFILMISPIQGIVVVGFFIFSLMAGVAFPIQKKLLNDAIIDSSHRATLLSIESIVDRAATAVVVFYIGDWVHQGLLNDALLAIAAGSFILVSLTVLLAKQFLIQNPSS